jgi:hypothetical protein
MLVITPTFTSNFDSNFGANAQAARAAWIAAASVFSSNFTDNIHINITVDATPGTSVFGESQANFPDGLTYARLRAALVADATTANDLTAIGANGSVPEADPTGGAGVFFLTRSQAKALGVIADDMANDGLTGFGAGNPFTFSGPITPGTFDFKGIAAHEISEVLGRQGLKTTGQYSLLDLFSFTGPGARDLVGGPNNNFSIDNGTTLLKLFNDPTVNRLDSRDWASDFAGAPPDSFNQFSSPDVVNPVTPVDLQLMDVIGYDLVAVAAAPALASAAHGLRVPRTVVRPLRM